MTIFFSCLMYLLPAVLIFVFFVSEYPSRHPIEMPDNVRFVYDALFALTWPWQLACLLCRIIGAVITAVRDFMRWHFRRIPKATARKIDA